MLPACKEPADTGSGADCWTPRTGSSLSGSLIQLLELWAGEPGGDCVAGVHAGTVAEAHSTDTARRVPAWWCRLVHHCKIRIICKNKMNPNLLHTVLDELSFTLCYHNYGIWTTYRNIANINIIDLTIKKIQKAWMSTVKEKDRVRGSESFPVANLSTVCWMKSSISSSRAGQHSALFSRAVMYGWGFFLWNKGQKAQVRCTTNFHSSRNNFKWWKLIRLLIKYRLIG